MPCPQESCYMLSSFSIHFSNLDASRDCEYSAGSVNFRCDTLPPKQLIPCRRRLQHLQCSGEIWFLNVNHVERITWVTSTLIRCVNLCAGLIACLRWLARERERESEILLFGIVWNFVHKQSASRLKRVFTCVYCEDS